MVGREGGGGGRVGRGVAVTMGEPFKRKTFLILLVYHFFLFLVDGNLKWWVSWDFNVCSNLWPSNDEV